LLKSYKTPGKIIIPWQHSQCMGYSISDICDLICGCVSNHTLKGNRLELSTPNLVHIYSMAVTQHALTGKSKGQRQSYENCHGHMIASGHHATATGVGLHVVWLLRF